jgi:hypothetical protein
MKEQVRRKGEERQVIGSIKGDGGPRSGTIYRWRDFKAAGAWSLSRKAISEDMIDVCVPAFHGQRPMKMKARLVVELEGGKMSWRFNSAPGYPIEYLPRATAKDIDGVKWWRAG